MPHVLDSLYINTDIHNGLKHCVKKVLLMTELECVRTCRSYVGGLQTDLNSLNKSLFKTRPSIKNTFVFPPPASFTDESSLLINSNKQ